MRSVVVPRIVPLIAILSSLLLPDGVAAQDGCQFVEPSGEFRRSVVDGSGVVRVRTPHIVCRDGVRIRADSARHVEATGFYQLWGNVDYDDPERRLEAQVVRYWRTDGRLEARRDVTLLRRTDGTLVRGDEMDFFEAGAGRPVNVLEVRGDRPVALLPQLPGGDPPPPDTLMFAPPPDTTGAGVTPDAAAAPSDSAAVPPGQYRVEADELVFRDVDHLTAIGAVEFERDSLTASAGFLEYDAAGERVRLREDARLTTPAWELAADSILTRLEEERFEDVRALGTAVLTGEEVRLSADSILSTLIDEQPENIRGLGRAILFGEDLHLAAPSIELFRPAGRLERLVAVRAPGSEAESEERGEDDLAARLGPEGDLSGILGEEHPDRPVARAQSVVLVADSIEVRAPGEVLETLFAVGRARAESTARDSLNTPSTPEIARRDWIEGDTVVATFIPLESEPSAVPAPDADPDPVGEAAPSGEYELERLVARGNARTLYRVPPDDPDGGASEPAEPQASDTISIELRPDAGPPAPDGSLAIHYATGDQIEIVLRGGEVARIEVTGSPRGWHFEPGARTARRIGGAAGGAAGGTVGGGG